MDFRLSQEEEDFRREVRDFLEKELPPEWIAGKEHMETDEEWAFSRSMMRKLAAKGWLCLAWPGEYGGQANLFKQLILNEEMFYYGAPGLDFVGVCMLSPVLISYGSEEQKQQHLPGIAGGEILWCECFSEPGAGSDLAAISTQAVEDGDDFIVNGQKTWISQAHRADWGFLLVRTDADAPKHRGISFLLMDMKMPGITVRPIIDMAGVHFLNEVFFDNVRVSKKNLVGEKNQGWFVAMALLGFERSGIHRLSLARRMVHLLVEYVKETRRDGVPLASDPLIRAKLAELAIECEVGRLLAYRVTWLQSKGLSVEHEPSISRLFGCELQQRVARVGMQVMGLYGQLKDESGRAPLAGVIQRFYLASIGATFAAGTSEIQRNVIAHRGLKLPRT